LLLNNQHPLRKEKLPLHQQKKLRLNHTLKKIINAPEFSGAFFFPHIACK
jgi:hypothetical protein